jgi:hypothetical protein
MFIYLFIYINYLYIYIYTYLYIYIIMYIYIYISLAGNTLTHLPSSIYRLLATLNANTFRFKSGCKLSMCYSVT